MGARTYKISFIEKASTGILRIRSETRSQGCPEPKFKVNGFFSATFWPSPAVQTDTEFKLLKAISGAMSRHQLQAALGLKNDEHFRKAYLLSALPRELIEMTIPDKPRSRNQRYRLTAYGHALPRKVNDPQQVANEPNDATRA